VKFYYIYQITNLINNKIYIGKHISKSLENDYMGSGKLLKKAISKYGLENFKKEILFIFDNEQEMNEKEKKLVTEEFCLRKDTYNLCVGGKGGFSFINRYKLNNNEKSKIRRIITRRENGVNYKKRNLTRLKNGVKINHNINKHGTFKGKKHTEETKQKISQSSKRRKKITIENITYNSFTEARKATGLNFNKLNKLFK
jgi:group I intron endonuclease